MAQLVEHWLPKPRVAGSSPVYRSLDGCVAHYDTPSFSVKLAFLHSTFTTFAPPMMGFCLA